MLSRQKFEPGEISPTNAFKYGCRNEPIEKTEVTGVSYELNRVLNTIPLYASSILDCGCGKGIVGALARIYRNTSRLVGLDIYDAYLLFCRKHGLYDEMLCHDLRMPLPFEEDEFDVVTCLETIEHLKRKDGMSLLEEMERVGRYVIITTPTRFFPQRAFDGNPHQIHQSLWNPEDFKSRGYEVRGVGHSFLFSGKQIPYISPLLSKVANYMPKRSPIMIAYKSFSYPIIKAAASEIATIDMK